MKKIIVLLLSVWLMFVCHSKKKENKPAEPKSIVDSLNLPSQTEVAVIKTDSGSIVITFYEQDAPEHTLNFKKLAQNHFYDGTLFHRVIEGVLIQGGDPLSKDDDRSNDGIGGPGYTLSPEIKMKHLRGCVGAARKLDKINPKRRSNGCQFYICLKDCPEYDSSYTVFGNVIYGMETVEKIASVRKDPMDNPVDEIKMNVRLHKIK